MTYNSELKDGLSENLDLYVKFGSGDDCKDGNELRVLFDQVLSFFLKEVSVNKHVFRPFPPKFGDGHKVDLFKLFLTVRRIGSYESVSKNEMWGFVAKECLLEIGFVSSLRLIYVKYLKEFDEWLIKGGFKDERVENLDIGVIEKLSFLSRELEGKSLVEEKEGVLELNPNGVVMNLENMPKTSRISGNDIKRSELLRENIIKKVGFSTINDDDDDDDDDDDKQIELSIKNVVDEVLRFHSDNDVMLVTNDDNVSSQKRKREEDSLLLSEMLDWVACVARDPHDNVYTSGKLWNQVLLARRTLFVKINVDSSNEAGGSQKKNQRMHPSMYDDNMVQARVPVQTRCTQRTKRLRTELVKTSTDPTPNTIEPHDNAYNLGPLYQAEVPPWTGLVSESDPKWLGTQMWPWFGPAHKNKNRKTGQVRTGPCECLFPGSADCVRFHIAENRLKLKLELGPLFYKWKFNQMGEEVSLSWEPEEEKVFKSLVVRARQELTHSSKSRREIMNKFWKQSCDSIPAKMKQNLVSYYFNVFVLRRRSYQNRVTPKEIDSDDDEQVVGSVGDRFGYEKIHGLSLKCSENLQCRDLDS